MQTGRSFGSEKNKGKGEILDIKTTQDARPEGFERELRKYNYDLQIAFYLHTMRCANLPCSEMYLVAIEKNAALCGGRPCAFRNIYKARRKKNVPNPRMYEARRRASELSYGLARSHQVHLPHWMEDEAEDQAF